MGTAEVNADALVRDSIRRVIRSHLNEVKYCVAQQRMQDGELEGRVIVTFVIGPLGKVTESKLKSSSLGNTKAEQCVTEAVRRWKFPNPSGGFLTVVYPFRFGSGGGD